MKNVIVLFALCIFISTFCIAGNQTDFEGIIRNKVQELGITITNLSRAGNIYNLKALTPAEEKIPQLMRSLDSSGAFDNVRLMMVRKTTDGSEFEMELKPKVQEQSPAPTVQPEPSAPSIPSKANKKEFDNDEIRRIAENSFGAYPLHMELTRTRKDTNQAYTTIIDVQSNTKIHAVMDAPIDNERLKLEAILIGPDTYLKVLSASDKTIKELLLPLGKWKKINKSHPGASFADSIHETINPTELMDSFGFSASELQTAQYTYARTEKIRNVGTNVYEITIKGETPVTYHQWIGETDRRIYRIEQELPKSSAVVILQYDPKLVVNKPTTE